MSGTWYVVVDKETNENIEKGLFFESNLKAQIFIEENGIDYDFYEIQEWEK